MILTNTVFWTENPIYDDILNKRLCLHPACSQKGNTLARTTRLRKWLANQDRIINIDIVVEDSLLSVSK